MAIAPKDQEIAALYREGGSDGPSAELDQAILQAARQALEPRPGPVAGWRRWRLHIPVLASLFMVGLFGLLISLNHPAPPKLDQLALNETPPPSPAQEAASPSGQVAAPPAESRARMAESPAPRAMAKAAITAQPAESSAPASANLTAGAPTPVPATAPTAAPSPMLADTGAPAIAKAESRAARIAATPVAPAVMAPPKEWLVTIQRLLDAKQIDEARSNLEAFEKAYPAETVPETLRRRLKP